MKSLSICTLGCRVNQYESRALAERFISEGYSIVPFGEKCDLCVVNTCAVTAESERKSAQMIRKASKLAKDVRVCGCFAETCADLPAKFPFVGKCTGANGKMALTDFGKAVFTDGGFEVMEIGNVPHESPSFLSRARAYLKIQDGCDGRCSYCLIPGLRGPSRCRPPQDIFAEARRLAVQGCKELILTGIETAAYDFLPLPKLLEGVSQTEGIERLRLGSLDPRAITEDFIKTAAENPKIMPHFHLSLQSGCDRILNLMRRPYNAAGAKTRIEALKAALPHVKLSADIICSFPTETKAELMETVKYIKDIGFLHIHAFSYSSRPGTAAAEMEGQIPEEEKRCRIKFFLAECTALKKRILSEKIGGRGKVLIEKRDGDYAYGHTEDFCEARIKANPYSLLKSGGITDVLIENTDGELLYCRKTDAGL